MDKKKLEKMFSDVRKKAVEVEQALSDSEKRKRAEAHRPKIDASNHFEEALKSDKILVRAALAVKAYDYNQSYGEDVSILTTEQEKELVRSLQSEEAQAVLRQVYEIYNGSVTYGKMLVALRSQWQRAVADLAILLTKWKAADETAKGMTSTLNEVCSTIENDKEWEDRKTKVPYYRELMAIVLKNQFEEAVAENAYKVYFNYNSDTQEFEADIDSGGLYSAILKKAETAKYQLRVLKGAVEPYSDFLYSEITFANGEKNLPLWYIPELIERLMEYPDAVEFDGDPNNDKYFQYKLQRRKDRGETITQADEKRAVIPDYNQVTIPEKPSYNAKIKLINLFKDLYQTDGRKD